MIQVGSTAKFVYVIHPNNKSGKRHRYTVHAIERYGSGRAKVIGRELPLRQAEFEVLRHQVVDTRKGG